MQEIKHIVNDPLGVHARPAAELVKIAKGFSSNITVNDADAKSILGIMKLALKQGAELIIKIDGADEANATATIAKFLETNL